MWRVLVVAVLCAALAADVALAGPVKVLEPESLQATIRNGKNWMVKYYAPWCGHCKRMAPVWKEFAEKMHKSEGSVNVAKFDCTNDRDACSHEGVRGYPTVRIYRADGRNYTYSGPRTVEAFASYSEFMTRDLVTRLKTKKEVEEVVAMPGIFFVRVLPRATNKAADNAYTAAAGDLLAQVMCYDLDASLREGTPLSTVRPGAVVRMSAGTPLVYDGNATDHAQLVRWMQDHEWGSCFELTRETGNRYAVLPSPKPLAVLVLDGRMQTDDLVNSYKKVAEAAGTDGVYQFAWAVYQKLPALTADVWGLEEGDLPALVVHNASASTFYRAPEPPLLPPASPDAPYTINATAVTTFLSSVKDGKVPATNPHSLFNSIVRFFSGSLLRIPSRVLASFAALQEQAPLIFYITIASALGAVCMLVFSARDIEDEPQQAGDGDGDGDGDDGDKDKAAGGASEGRTGARMRVGGRGAAAAAGSGGGHGDGHSGAGTGKTSADTKKSK